MIRIQRNTMWCSSSLGSKLVIIYINDVCNISPTLKFTLFADNTNIFYGYHICKNISRQLSIVNEWFCVNKFSLNLEKTFNFYLQIVNQSKVLPKKINDNNGYF